MEPQLPTRFPCWCRAIYSWGGETKRDLGFIEGDLIECLNAGDGAWWTGRLRRDKRMVGFFPSNFVKVLSEDFAPASRSVSPMGPGAAGGIKDDLRRDSLQKNTHVAAAVPKKQTTFRKPFQGYKEAVGPSEALRLKKEAEEIASMKKQLEEQQKEFRMQRLREQKRVMRQDSRDSRNSRNSGTPPTQPLRNRGSVSSYRSSYRESYREASPQTFQNHGSVSSYGGAYREPYRESPPQTLQNHGSYRGSHRESSRSISPIPPHMPLPIAHDGMPLYAPVSAPTMQAFASVPSPAPIIAPAPPRSPVPITTSSPMPATVSTMGLPPSHSPLPVAAPVPIHSPVAFAPAPHPSSTYEPAPYTMAPSPTPSPGPYSIPSHAYVPRQAYSPVPSPAPCMDDSPPPPPPPPHRILNRPNKGDSQQLPAPSPLTHPRPTSPYLQRPMGTPSPHPPTPGTPNGYGNTPSPLRDAMEDVMSSLHDMGIPRNAPSPEPTRPASNQLSRSTSGQPSRSVSRATSPYKPWSPQAFQELQRKPDPHESGRPMTSLGLPSQYNASDESDNESFQDGPSQPDNYIQRMESRLRQLHEQARKASDELHLNSGGADSTPPVESELNITLARPKSSVFVPPADEHKLRNRKSAIELGRGILGRTSTTKSIMTNSSSGVQSNSTHNTSSTQNTGSTGVTGKSVMSGFSAGAFSATSAESFAKRAKAGSFSRSRPSTAMASSRFAGDDRPHTPSTGMISYHSSHNTSRQGATSAIPWSEFSRDEPGNRIHDSSVTPKSKKTGFFKKLIESAKTGAATARSNMANSNNSSPTKSISGRLSAFSAHRANKSSSRLTTTSMADVDWVQVRRDINRATTPSNNELIERAERCQMEDYPVIYSVEELYQNAEGDEGIDGLPITEPTDWAAWNLHLVDKGARFLNTIPAMLSPAALAQSYVCRPHRSDVQRLRAIFTWVSEKLVWDEDIDGGIDLRRVIQTRRGSSREVSVLVYEMCSAIGIHSEVVRGYLKVPGEELDLDALNNPNHWWNVVLTDGEWRVMDCSLASPSNPRRGSFLSFSSHAAESWYFLTRPMEICYSHIPLIPEQQHICPTISPDVLLALPNVTPPFFKNGLSLPEYDTSLLRINDLEIFQLRIHVPPDIECTAEMEAHVFARDADGDLFESGEVVRKLALSQPDWCKGQKRYLIKALLPSDEGKGVVKVYAGKKGLMHSNRDIPYPLVLALPITHSGDNPPYEFVLRHPTPHAMRHDLYIIQPQCAYLAVNNTFVFAVRQHPALSPNGPRPEDMNDGRMSPIRPGSALSMSSSAAASSHSSGVPLSFTATSSNASSLPSKTQVPGPFKPAKLAIQSPSGKILRLIRKADHVSFGSEDEGDAPDGSIWETVIKMGERGMWRGLVLADRSARWCVWAEWECV